MVPLLPLFFRPNPVNNWFVAALWLEAREALGGADVGEVVDEDAQDPFAGTMGPRDPR